MSDTRVLTGLPYDINMMIDHIQQEGAIVDMSNISFPNVSDIKQQIRTTLVYLRNTNFDNVSLDFSKVSQQDICTWLVDYITSDIHYNIVELNEMWMCVIVYRLINNNLSDFITNETMDSFIADNETLIDQLIDFYNSLSLFVIKRVSWADQVDFSETKVNECPTFGKNAYNIIKMPNFPDVISIIDRPEPVLFTTLFVENNNELFDIIINHTPFAALMYGMIEDQDRFKSMVDQMVDVMMTDVESEDNAQ